MDAEWDRTPWQRTRAWLIADLREHRCQSSWDWEADKRWAEMKGDAAMQECIDVLINSTGIDVLRANYHDAYVRRQVTEPRLRALRRLVREGHAVAYWQGAGEGARNNFGVGRFRVYALA